MDIYQVQEVEILVLHTHPFGVSTGGLLGFQLSELPLIRLMF